MRNQWEAFNDDNEVEIPMTTSNPLRKIKKIKTKQEKYNKNPSPELYNELLKLKEKLKIFMGEPVKEVKKKNLKKRELIRQRLQKEKKRKKDNERKERFNAEYSRWQQEQYEKNRKDLRNKREEEYTKNNKNN